MKTQILASCINNVLTTTLFTGADNSHQENREDNSYIISARVYKKGSRYIVTFARLKRFYNATDKKSGVLKNPKLQAGYNDIADYTQAYSLSKECKESSELLDTILDRLQIDSLHEYKARTNNRHQTIQLTAGFDRLNINWSSNPSLARAIEKKTSMTTEQYLALIDSFQEFENEQAVSDYFIGKLVEYGQYQGSTAVEA